MWTSIFFKFYSEIENVVPIVVHSHTYLCWVWDFTAGDGELAETCGFLRNLFPTGACSLFCSGTAGFFFRNLLPVEISGAGFTTTSSMSLDMERLSPMSSKLTVFCFEVFCVSELMYAWKNTTYKILAFSQKNQWFVSWLACHS